ncbi:MAG TPA: methyltransferase domain-containing protein [Polyangiales bacterium]|nr:methyltransferase domain-containing protein [Polyangiales bacterium]
MDGSPFLRVSIAGSDTGRDLNLHKRVAIVARAAGPLPGKRLLDCGCGAGAYAREYAKLGAHVVGVEYQRDKVRAAPRGVPGLLVVAGDASALPLSAASFDVAVLNEVLEHVPDQRRVLSELHRVLAPSGRLVLMSPNRLYPFESHGVNLRASKRPLPAYTPFVPYVPLALGTRLLDYWARNYWPWELRRMVRDAGFRIVHTGFVAQTFENISGQQPGWVKHVRPALREAFSFSERIPGLRALCSVSQLVVADKP